MRRLALFRHAKAERHGSHDHERPLAERGRTAAPAMGRWLADAGFVPDLVLCSTALRTRETWALAEPAFAPDSVEVQFDRRVYAASAARLLALVQAADDAVERLLVVGHNPGLHDLADLLAGGGAAASRAALAEGFPTAAIVLLDFDLGRWRGVDAGQGRLAAFVTPKSLGIGAA
jgi:phosphohistidine phosphatase